MAIIVAILKKFLICEDVSFVKPGQAPQTFRELCLDSAKIAKNSREPLKFKFEEKTAVFPETPIKFEEAPRFFEKSRETCENCSELRAEMREIREIIKEKPQISAGDACVGRLLRENVEIKLQFLEKKQVFEKIFCRGF